MPFEQAAPWDGSWDDLPAAHLAAMAFDLLCLVLLFLVGRRARGPDLGIALAYAWASYPFTLFASNSNTNDSLVAVLVLLALLVAGRPVARGAAAALAGLTKFAPLALAPVLATHGLVLGRRGRGLGLFAAGFVVAALVAGLPVLLHESLSAFYDRTHLLPGLARLAVLGLGPLRLERSAARGPGARRGRWRSAWRSFPAARTWRGWPRPAPPSCSALSWASRTGSTCTSRGSSGWSCWPRSGGGRTPRLPAPAPRRDRPAPGWAGAVALLGGCWAAMWKLAPFSDTRITDVYVYAARRGAAGGRRRPLRPRLPVRVPAAGAGPDLACRTRSAAATRRRSAC